RRRASCAKCVFCQLDRPSGAGRIERVVQLEHEPIALVLQLLDLALQAADLALLRLQARAPLVSRFHACYLGVGVEVARTHHFPAFFSAMSGNLSAAMRTPLTTCTRGSSARLGGQYGHVRVISPTRIPHR